MKTKNNKNVLLIIVEGEERHKNDKEDRKRYSVFTYDQKDRSTKITVVPVVRKDFSNRISDIVSK